MKNLEIDPLHHFEKTTKEVERDFKRAGKTVFAKYPLTFGLLSTFGIVAVMYGFEGTIDKVQFLSDRPWLILVLGVIALMITGGLYKRLKN